MVLKDISREVYVTLKYVIDPDSGVLGRSATVENKTKDSLVINQVAAAAWTLPHAPDYDAELFDRPLGRGVPVAERKGPPRPASP